MPALVSPTALSTVQVCKHCHILYGPASTVPLGNFSRGAGLHVNTWSLWSGEINAPKLFWRHLEFPVFTNHGVLLTTEAWLCNRNRQSTPLLWCFRCKLLASESLLSRKACEHYSILKFWFKTGFQLRTGLFWIEINIIMFKSTCSASCYGYSTISWLAT